MSAIGLIPLYWILTSLYTFWWAMDVPGTMSPVHNFFGSLGFAVLFGWALWWLPFTHPKIRRRRK